MADRRALAFPIVVIRAPCATGFPFERTASGCSGFFPFELFRRRASRISWCFPVVVGSTHRIETARWSERRALRWPSRARGVVITLTDLDGTERHPITALTGSCRAIGAFSSRITNSTSTPSAVNLRSDQGEVLVEQRIEQQPVGLILDQAGGKCFTERLALHTHHPDGTQSVHALGD
jgi:hypothetical protein